MEYYLDVMKRQAVVNSGVTFRFRNQTGGKFETTDFRYDNGILDYVTELAGENPPDPACVLADRAEGPGPGGQAGVQGEAVGLLLLLQPGVHHGALPQLLLAGARGSPEKAMKSAFVSAIDARLKQLGKYQKSEGKISFNDIQDCLVLVSNNFSTQTSYENQTKKAINNKFVQEAMTEFLRSQLEVYFIENRLDAQKICRTGAHQQAQPGRPRKKTRLNIKKKLSGSMDISNRVQFVDCRSIVEDVGAVKAGSSYIVEGDSAMGARQKRSAGTRSTRASCPSGARSINCLKADYPPPDPHFPQK